MTGLIQTIAGAPASRPLFFAADGEIAAGRIRATATAIEAKVREAENIYLFTESASLFVAGLLAASRKNCSVSCPAHLQPQYLREIGAEGRIVLTDRPLDQMGSVLLTLAPPGASDAGVAISGDPDLVFYTSGVTGTPKAVPKKLRQLDAEAAMLATVWPNGARRVFGTVSHQHIYGMLFRIFWPILSGGISADIAAHYWERLAGRLAPGTTLVSSPAHLTRLPPMPTAGTPDLVFSSGAVLPHAAALAASKQFGSLPIEVLGSTETGGIAWRRQDREDALWMPFPAVEIEGDDQGQLCVHSPFAANKHSISTGDLFEREGTKFRLKGRSDTIAKIDGKRVSLVRVEDALLALDGIEGAAPVVLPKRGGALGAVVELNAAGIAALAEKGSFRLSREFRRALAKQLEPAERPKHWRFGNIPRDPQGKRVQLLLRGAFDDPLHSTLGCGTVRSVDACAAIVRIELTPDMIWFEGHFPERPVLAGVAQIHMAALWARQVWDWSPAGENLSRLKFRHVLRPGDIVDLMLERAPEKRRLSFCYRLNDTVATEGTIEVEA